MDNYVLYVIVLLIIGFKCMFMENMDRSGKGKYKNSKYL